MITVQSSTYPPNYQDTPEAYRMWLQYITNVIINGWDGPAEEEEHPELNVMEG